MLALLDPAVNALHSALVGVAIHLPGPPGAQLALALVLITWMLRAAMVPLSLRAHRTQQRRTALAPEIERLKKRHAKDHVQLAHHLSALHRDAGVSPFGGLGVLLLQLPVFATLYRLVVVPVVTAGPNALVAATLWGAPLSAHWLPTLAGGGTALLCLGMLGALLAIAHLSSRQQPAGPALLRLLPYGTVAFAAVAPIAVSIYLLSTTAWSVAERAMLTRYA